MSTIFDMPSRAIAEVRYEPDEEPPRVGRPRKEGGTRAILDATLEILAEEGFAGLSVEAISSKAKIGRPALYRRWPSKEAIVEAALLTLADELLPIPDTGSLRRDLTLLVQQFVRSIDSQAGRVIVALIGEAIRDESWHDILADFLTKRRSQALAIVDRAVKRGELPRRVDGDFLFDLIASPLWVHLLLHRDLETWSKSQTDRLVDVVLAGLSAVTPKPGRRRRS